VNNTSAIFKRNFKLLNLTSKLDIATPLESVCKDAVYHHYADDLSIGPKVLDLNINAILTHDDAATVYVYIYPEVANLPPNRKILNGVKQRDLIAKYHKGNRRLSRVLNLTRTLTKKDNLFITYNAINHYTKRIMEKYLMVYDEYAGILKIVGDGVAELETDRMQILSIRLPQIVPPEAELIKLALKPTDTLRRAVKTLEDVSLIELVKTLATGEGSFKGILSAPDMVVTLQDGLNLIHIDINKFKELKEDKTDLQVVKWVADLITELTSKRVTSATNETPTYYEALDVEVKVDDEPNTPSKQAKQALAPLLARGSITSAEAERHLKVADTYKAIPSPNGDGTIEDEIKIATTKEVTFKPKSLPKLIGVNNDNLSSAKRQLDEEYITNQLPNDLVATFMSMQQGPFAVTGLTKEITQDAGNKDVLYKLQTKALQGGQGTAVVEIPSIKPDGTFQSGGVDYRMAVQRVTFPIAKIAPNEVAMTGVSKMFLTCGDKKANDYPGWVVKNLKAAADNKIVTKLTRAKVPLPIDVKLNIPMMFAVMGKEFTSFTLAGHDFNFSTENIKDTVAGRTRCGTSDNTPMYMDAEGIIYLGTTASAEPIGTIPSLLGLNESKAPLMFAELKLKGKQLPVIAILSYWLGFTGALQYLMLDYEVVKLTDRVSPNDAVVKFSDAKVVIKVKSQLDRLLANGWYHFRHEIEELKVGELDATHNFSAIFTPKGITRSHEIELDIMRQYWISPNTAKLLKSRDYPTEMIPLLVKCTDLLTHHQHYLETDGDILIERGYSRLNDIIHGELVQGVRDFSRNPNPNRKLTINPQAVKLAILMDESVSPIERVNPLGVMGEQDRIVSSGNLGRSGQSMVGRHRVYHPNDRGRISEAFTDDGKAGTVLYYSNNPSIENYYGVGKKDTELNPANLLSFAFHNSPFVTFDDAKRGNFARIQGNAMRASNGSTIPPVMTNAGLAVAHRAGRVYALVSKLEGKVTSVTDTEIEIQYKDGTTDSYSLGLNFGSGAGKTYPRDLVTDRKAGYKFEAGEVLAWDSYHLFRDRYNVTQTNMYNGVWDIVVFRERAGTYEDASRMSTASANKTASDIVHIRPIALTFNDNLKLNFKVGDEVDQDQALAYITPPGIEISTAEEASSLDYFSAASPKAKYDGKIVRIEAFYMGDKTEATPELLKVINEADKARAKRSQSEDISPTGEYRKPTFIQKQQLNKNSVIILVYILHEEVTVAGDKVANANSLKTVPGKIYETRYTLPDGTPIDSDSSYKGLKARITPGAELLGLMGLFVRQVGLNAAKAYRSK
jgi:hypothetical protein